MARTGANWRVKELQEQLARATGGGKPPRKGPDRRDLAYLGAGAAGGGAAGYAAGRRGRVRKSSKADQIVDTARRGARAVTAGADAWQGGTTVQQRRGRMALYGVGGLAVGGAAAGAGASMVPKKKEKAVAKSLVELSKGASHTQDGTNVRISYVKPAHKTTTLNARSGVMSGRTRGKGTRQESRDANSTPKVEWIKPRRLDGKYASNATIIDVIKPHGARRTSMNTLEVHGKGVSKGMTQTSGATKEFGARNRVGRRL